MPSAKFELSQVKGLALQLVQGKLSKKIPENLAGKRVEQCQHLYGHSPGKLFLLEVFEQLWGESKNSVD